MPEISVIIPMYKTPKLCLRRCLESLIAQTFTDFEVLVIDDGNEPGYEYLKEEYEKADSRISFVRQEHSGVSNARNLGLRMAKGQYISFIDSDDFVEIDFLEEMRRAMQDADVAICAVGEQYYPVAPGWIDRRVFWSRPSYYNGLQYINFCHNKMFRASLIRENDIQFRVGMKLGEDAVFIADYLKCCKSFRMVREPLYHYVPDSKSAVHRYREEYWNWEEQVIERQWELFHEYPLSENEEQAMEHWLYLKLKYAMYYYLEREKDHAKRTEKLKEITGSPLFARLTGSTLKKGHRHISRNNRMIIKSWKLLGIYGVRLTYFVKCVVQKIRRKSWP